MGNLVLFLPRSSEISTVIFFYQRI